MYCIYVPGGHVRANKDAYRPLLESSQRLLPVDKIGHRKEGKQAVRGLLGACERTSMGNERRSQLRSKLNKPQQTKKLKLTRATTIKAIYRPLVISVKKSRFIDLHKKWK